MKNGFSGKKRNSPKLCFKTHGTGGILAGCGKTHDSGRIIFWKHLWYLSGIAAIIFILILFSASVRNSSIQKGVLNLSNWNYKSETIMNLNGEWEFYWNRLLTSFSPNDSEKNYVPVPGCWNNYSINGEKLPGTGVATYRLQIRNAPADVPLAIRVQSMSTAYRLYINGVLTASNGSLSDTAQGYRPEYRVTVSELPEGVTDYNLVIQVENEEYARGGIWYGIRLGESESIHRLDKMIEYKDLFLLGCYFIMILYLHLIVIKKKDYRHFCFMASVGLMEVCRILIYGSFSIRTFFPGVSFDQIVRIDYSSNFLISLLSIFFIFLLLGYQIKERWPVVGLSVGVLLGILFLPIYKLTSLVPLLNGFMAMTALLLFGVLFYAVHKHCRYAGVLLFGLSAYSMTACYDLLYQMNLVDNPFGELNAFGFIVFYFCIQNVLMNLENISEQAEVTLLNEQIKPHFLHNTLNTIIILSRSEPDRSRNLLADLSEYLRAFYLPSEKNRLQSIESEVEFLKRYAEIQRARYGNGLKFEFEIENTDVQIPHLCLQPLVENAVLHGVRGKEGGGTIVIYSRQAGKRIRIGVRDNGAGFDCSDMNLLFSGTGINNVNQRLKKIMGTGLVFESRPGAGTNVYFEVSAKSGKGQSG